MKELVVGAVQMESPVGEVRANADRMCGWMDKAAREGAQLVVFPECCLTGYSTACAEKAAILADDDVTVELEQHARELSIAVGYGYMERCTTDKPYVTYVVAGPEGRLVYRKTHLGSREQQAFAAGDELPAACIAGVRIGVQLCWEAHIPDITTTLRAKGAELVLMPHAVGIDYARRMELWSRCLPARAYDNGLFVVACNALRREGEGAIVGGGIVAYSPDGELITASGSAEEEMLLVHVGGVLPRDNSNDGMRGVSYFDRRRPELYSEKIDLENTGTRRNSEQTTN